MIKQIALNLAYQRVLPKGYKPEDYFSVDGKGELSLIIAKQIYLEYKHIIRRQLT